MHSISTIIHKTLNSDGESSYPTDSSDSDNEDCRSTRGAAVDPWDFINVQNQHWPLSYEYNDIEFDDIDLNDASTVCFSESLSEYSHGVTPSINDASTVCYSLSEHSHNGPPGVNYGILHPQLGASLPSQSHGTIEDFCHTYMCHLCGVCPDIRVAEVKKNICIGKLIEPPDNICINFKSFFCHSLLPANNNVLFRASMLYNNLIFLCKSNSCRNHFLQSVIYFR